MKTLRPASIAVLCALAAGCMTYPSEEEIARQIADMGMLQEEVQRLKARMEGIELEQRNLAREVGAIRQGTPQGSQTDRARVEALERQVQALNAAREQDRRQIVEELSRKVSALLSSQPSTARSGGGSEYGYEHVVKPGETLSEIARAYKVSMTAIQKANNLSSPDLVRVGQKLFIPQP
jgi:LysM repeat protein